MRTRVLALGLALSACDADVPVESLELRVTVANISSPGALAGADIWMAPGIWVVHDAPGEILAPGEPASPGLEALAEDGNNKVLFEALDGSDGVVARGVFGTPRVGETYDDAPIEPGMMVSFKIEASSDQYLSIASMFVQSNDIVVALHDLSLADYAQATPALLDVGTEVNEPPGGGANQPMMQPEAGAGEAEGGVVRAVDDGFDYPALDSFAELTIERL